MTGTPRRTGGDVFLDALAGHGVRHLFNNPGNGVWGLIDAMVDKPIEYVMALHEASLVSMSDGYARATGRPAVSNVYMMPGTANAMSAMNVARHDRSPLVVTGLQQMSSLVGRESYGTNDDYPALARSVTKWTHEVTSIDRLPEAVHRAFAIAMTPPRGPVFLSLPYDLLEGAAPEHNPLEPSRPTSYPTLGGLDPSALTALTDALRGAERPVLIAGKEVVDCDAVDLLIAFAERLGLPVLQEEWAATMVMPSHHRLRFGPAVEFGNFSQQMSLLQPDFIFHIGARIFSEVGGPAPSVPATVKTAAIGERPFDMGRSAVLDFAFVVNVRTALQQLLADNSTSAEQDAVTARRNDRVDRIARDTARTSESDDRSEGQRPSPHRVMREINKIVTPEMLLVEHATSSNVAFQDEIDVVDTRNFFGTSSSTQGWGLPAAIGIQMARPTEKVLAVVGDGGFCFAPQGLATAANSEVPVTVVVLNNSGYGVMTAEQDERYPRTIGAGSDLKFDFDVDAAAIARGFGVDAVRVSDTDEIAHAVGSAVDSDCPTVVEIMVGPRN